MFHNLPVVAEMNIIFLFLIKLEISAVVLAPYPDNRQCRADTGKHNHGNHKFLKKCMTVKVTVFANQVDRHIKCRQSVCQHNKGRIKKCNHRALFHIIGNNRLPRLYNRRLKRISDNVYRIHGNKIRNSKERRHQMSRKKQHQRTARKQDIS